MSGKSKFIFILFILSLLLLAAGAIVSMTYFEFSTFLMIGTALCAVGALLLLISLATIIGWKNFFRYLYATFTASMVFDSVLSLVLSGDIVGSLVTLAISVVLVIGMVPICFKRS